MPVRAPKSVTAKKPARKVVARKVAKDRKA